MTDDPYRAAHESAALFDLSARAKIELSGKDATTFLHNLCTNDIKGLAVGRGCEAFLTTHKARIVAHILVSRILRSGDESFLVDSDPNREEALLRHLSFYLISEQVELTDRTAEWAMFHVCGSRAKNVLEQAGGFALPELAWMQHTELSPSLAADGWLRRRDYLGVPGFDVFVPAVSAVAVRDSIVQAGTVFAADDIHEILRVEAGWPVFGKDFDEDRLVMEVGRTRQAISYTKGCFLGQEPIVMARDRGHVNRTLLGLRVASDTPVPSGAKVIHEGKEVGQVTSSVRSPCLGVIALAYLQRGSQTPGTEVEIETAEGKRAAIVTGLPFSEAAPAPA